MVVAPWRPSPRPAWFSELSLAPCIGIHSLYRCFVFISTLCIVKGKWITLVFSSLQRKRIWRQDERTKKENLFSLARCWCFSVVVDCCSNWHDSTISTNIRHSSSSMLEWRFEMLHIFHAQYRPYGRVQTFAFFSHLSTPSLPLSRIASCSQKSREGCSPFTSHFV